jgi:Zn ribbon nucleic-acid-binding protein
LVGPFSVVRNWQSVLKFQIKIPIAIVIVYCIRCGYERDARTSVRKERSFDIVIAIDIVIDIAIVYCIHCGYERDARTSARKELSFTIAITITLVIEIAIAIVIVFCIRCGYERGLSGQNGVQKAKKLTYN